MLSQMSLYFFSVYGNGVNNWPIDSVRWSKGFIVILDIEFRATTPRPIQNNTYTRR